MVTGLSVSCSWHFIALFFILPEVCHASNAVADLRRPRSDPRFEPRVLDGDWGDRRHPAATPRIRERIRFSRQLMLPQQAAH